MIYDGDCPFCASYVKLVRIREACGELALIDAREGGPVVDELVAAGFDLDEGMVLKMGGRYYHGADCIHALALMGSSSTLFNKFNAWTFASPGRSKLLYPVLRACRNLALRALMKKKLNLALPGE
ncbi:MAG: DCC1-like thiol-disulfide oxidoreductase family protein [Pseudomonadota bacterium]